MRWSVGSDVVDQDVSPQAKVVHMKNLLQRLLYRVHARMRERGGVARETDECAYWIRVAVDVQDLAVPCNRADPEGDRECRRVQEYAIRRCRSGQMVERRSIVVAVVVVLASRSR